ncbi:FecR domain-containing protein [Phenylobacterium aquaticum]|uniref:FecR family protein n=1 Tax=Phenylobacterium aquaticum TaxID=1763816 RepID=UPI0026F1C4D6|nr:FecR domain-containing protein [Phenylobacterium aquaticum]
MNQKSDQDQDADRDVATQWLARLERPDVGEADWLAFDAWLEAAPSHKQAYDDALALWSELEAHAPDLAQALNAAPSRPAASRNWMVMAGGLAAAGLVAAVAVPWQDLTAPTTTYQTAKGERKTVVLADGTRIDLNAGSRLTVHLGTHERRVEMADAEAVFDVAKDAKRPFLITAGDRTVRVVGTQFDVRHRDGRQSVVVARGVVEVRPTGDAPGRGYRLTVGQRLDHREGEAEARVGLGSPEAAMSWRSGKFVYRGEPLANVVADLNQYVPRPVRLADARTAELAFSGVLAASEGPDMVRTLTLIAPVTSTETPDGLLLRAK